MTPERLAQVKRICDSVLDLDPQARSARLNELCAGDTDLRCDVDLLLADATRAAHTDSASTRWTPDTIGRYRIGRVLGEGGMGVVYEAEQDQPSRRVALKVIAPGWPVRRSCADFVRNHRRSGGCSIRGSRRFTKPARRHAFGPSRTSRWSSSAARR